MRRIKISSSVVGLALLTSFWTSGAFAEEETIDPEDASLFYDEELERTWLASIEVGVLMTSGNTEKSSFKGKVDATQDLPKWRNIYSAEAFSSNDRDQTTAERYRASAKSDYKLFADQQYLFARLAGVDDRFSGYNYEITSSIGYGFRAWEKSFPFSSESGFLDLEAGPGYRFAKIRESQLVEGQDDNERAGIIRLAGRFLRPLNENARLSQTLSTESSVVGDDNFIAESETAIVTNLIRSLAMKVSVNLRYVKEPPENTRSTDTETSITLIYTL